MQFFYLHGILKNDREEDYATRPVQTALGEKMLKLELLKILNKIKDKLSDSDRNMIIELIENQEWGMAYEILCTQLCEYEVLITSQVYDDLSAYGKLVGLSPSIWYPLKNLIVDKD